MQYATFYTLKGGILEINVFLVVEFLAMSFMKNHKNML